MISNKFITIIQKLVEKNSLSSKVELLEGKLNNTPIVENGKDGKDGSNIVDIKQVDKDQILIELNTGDYFSVNLPKGEKGDKGQDGIIGIQGNNGVSISDIKQIDEKLKIELSDNSIHEFIVRDGLPGKNGIQGVPGSPGVSGINGKDGKDGQNGISIKNIKENKDSFDIELDNGYIQNISLPQGIKGEDGQNGKDGVNGKDGNSIVEVTQDSNNSFNLILSNGDKKTIKLRECKDGKNGTKGSPGKDGISITEIKQKSNTIVSVKLSNNTVTELKLPKGSSGKDANTSRIEKDIEVFKNSVSRRVDSLASQVMYAGSGGSGEVLLTRLDDVDVSGKEDQAILFWDATTSNNHYKSITEFTGTTIRNINTIFSNTTITINDDVILCDCSNNAISIELLDASLSSGRVINIKKIDNTGNRVNVYTPNTETIDGANTKIILNQYTCLTLVSDSNNYFII